VKLEKAQLGVRAAGGRVDMNPIAANLYGGTLAGSASVNALNHQFALKQQLAGVDIGPLLRDAAGKDLLEGRGKLTLDVQTAGRTTTALKKALNGSAAMALTDGALKGINLAEALRKAKAALGSKSAEQAASKGDKTDFSELTASFAIRNGVAHNDDLAMKSPFIRLGGTGDLDIGENRMNYLAKASVVNTSAGQGGKDLESLSGLTVPVRVSGPFESLSYRIEIGSLVSDSVKQKLQESVKEKVQDRLKGLFKR
jgi:AsmA protein